MQANQEEGGILLKDNNIGSLPQEHEAVAKEEKPDLIKKYSLYVNKSKERAMETSKMAMVSGLLIVALVILTLASTKNPDIYRMDAGTAARMNMAFNALIVLVLPFFGMTGSVTRLTVSNCNILG
jgi:hypothetical protein